MMDFGSAINAVKQGQKLYREGWLTPGSHIRLEGIDKIMLVIGGHTPTTYHPGSGDMLAEDWRYLPLAEHGEVPAGDPVARATYEGREGPTVPKETVEAGNAIFVDTAAAGVVPVAPAQDAGGDGGAAD